MRKTLITLLCAVCAFAASAQTRYLRINQLDGTVTKLPLVQLTALIS